MLSPVSLRTRVGKMDSIVRNTVEIIFISIALLMGITTAFHIINDGGDLIEFVVENQTYQTVSTMDFSSVVIDESYIQFNDTGFHIDCSNSIDITLSYIHDDISSAGDGDRILSFSADTNSGLVWFNISGFIPGTGYLVKRDDVNFDTMLADGSGYVSFSNSEWSSHDFDIYQQGGGNSAPYLPSNPSPGNGASDVGLSSDLSWSGGDPDGDSVSYDVYFGMSSPPNKVSGNQSQTSYNLGGLSYDTMYYWRIVSWDEHGAKRVGSVWSFQTEAGSDTTPPVIGDLSYDVSDPIDVSIGWEKISVIVTDDVGVTDVYLRIVKPDLSTENLSMTEGSGDTYFYNNTFILPGDYTYSVWATDGGGNGVSSSEESFTLYANWDINMDRICDNLDLVAVSNIYGSSDDPGWIREDVDNNGIIQVLDITITATNYGSSY